MAKLKISDYSSTSAGANLNTDINTIDIDEGCAPSGINNAIRTLMAQLKDFQTGVSGDGLTLGGALSGTSATFSGNVTASAISGASLTLSGNVTASAISGASMTLSGDLTVDTDTLYVDSTNNKVGIGTASPNTYGGALNVADGNVGGETTLVVTNNNANQFVRLGIKADVAHIAYDNGDTLVFGVATDSTTSGITTERMRITSGGSVGIATTGEIAGDSSGNGGVYYSYGNWLSVAASSSVVGIFNRMTSDGTIVQFRQNGSTEGFVSVSGSTVSYVGGHLARLTQLPNSTKDESILKGTVLSNLDEMCVYVNAETGETVNNEQLNKAKVSDVEGDPNVAGVHVAWIYDEQHDVEEINMAMTGDMIIRIAQGVTVNRGDLLMSAGDGTAKPQGDDIVRSKTIAKVTSTSVTCTYEDGSYCVPCVLMAC